MHIVAVPGRQVRDPATRRVVDATPLKVDPTDLYWARALADGDVTQSAELPPAPAPATGNDTEESAK